MIIGDNDISQLTKSNIMLLNWHINNSCQVNNNLLWLGLPAKLKTSVYFSLGVIIQQLKRDLKSPTLGGLLKQLKKGGKALILGSELVEFVSVSNIGLNIKISQTNNYGGVKMIEKVRHHLPISYLSFIKPYSGSRSKYSTVLKIFQKAKNRRGIERPIDRLLLSNRADISLGVPSGLLKSKVLIVSSQGDLQNLKKKFKSINLFGEKANKILGEYVLIQKDLNEYSEFFNSENKALRKRFNRVYIPKLHKLCKDYPELKIDITKLILDFSKGEYNQELILELRDNIKMYYSIYPEFYDNLVKYFPRFSNPLPSSLKLVILDSVNSFSENRNTINALIDLNIKVVVIYDLMDISKMENNWFDNNLRFFWDKKKIKSLRIQINHNYLDNEIVKMALRYSDQIVKIILFDEDGITKSFWENYSLIKELEGFEKLKNYFWNMVHPAYFILKNEPNIINAFKLNLLSELKSKYLDLKIALDNKTIKCLEDFLNKIDNFENKKETSLKIIFSQNIPFNGKIKRSPIIDFPCEYVFSNDLNNRVKNISFTGIPYKEYQEGMLNRSIIEFLVPQIEVLCWTKEYGQLKGKLDRLICSNWLTDNLPMELYTNISLPISDIEKEEKDYYNIKDNRSLAIDISGQIESIIQEEKDLYKKRFNYRHSNYRGDNNSYTKISLVIHLPSNSWIYLPKKESIYTFDFSNNKIRKTKTTSLTPNSILVLFKLSKEDIRHSVEDRKGVDSLFDNLEIWTTALQNMFIKCNRDYSILEFKLLQLCKKDNVDANPAIYNLRRWLNEDDLTLAPIDSNLEMILRADNVIQHIDEIIIASKKIRRIEKKLRMNIIAEIIANSDNFFHRNQEIFSRIINVSNVKVKIVTTKILSIDEEAIEVDSHYVKKIIQ